MIPKKNNNIFQKIHLQRGVFQKCVQENQILNYSLFVGRVS